ncbi:MAG: 6-carboxytetrahydropterin synthase QueD [Candidatus Thorarchaeota archaeon]|nr:6-carboxytetrahydropterin synthase QueD [Candidatus Thorarchaeota archaeon]
MHSIKLHDSSMHFSSAHFVMGADYCEGLHGHNYHVEVVLVGPLNSLGMVMDFRELKKQVVQICKKLDHRVLLPGESRVITIQESGSNVVVEAAGKRYELPEEDCTILPISATTVEILAQYIAESLSFDSRFQIEVCVAENVGSKGCYSLT